MKFNRTIRVLLFFLAPALFFLFSCHKNDKSGGNSLSVTQSAQNNAYAEAQYNDVTTMVDQVGINNVVYNTAGGRGSTPIQNGFAGNSCATASIDTTVNPHQITIDFGSSNCSCLDGRNRRGKILANFTGHYRDSGTVIHISFDNYFVDDNQIMGTKTVTNKGHNTLGHLVYEVVTEGQIVKAGNGGTITWNSTRSREWKEGETTLNPLDDVYGITGSASGTNADGTAYTINIDQELVRRLNCFWFESGKLTLTQTGLPSITLDYGNTGCDANATVTALGVTYPIVLK